MRQAFISSALPERISAWTSVFPLSILVWLYRVRLYSAPLLAVVAAYMNGARIVHLAHEQPRYRQLIMETASRELFGGNHTGIRITLFRDVGFWKAIPLYLYSVRHGFIRFTAIHSDSATVSPLPVISPRITISVLAAAHHIMPYTKC